MNKKLSYIVLTMCLIPMLIMTSCAPTAAPEPTPKPTLIPAILPETNPTEAVSVEPVAEPTEEAVVEEEVIPDGGTVSLFMTVAPDTFIPQYTLGSYTRFIADQYFSRLLRYDADTRLIASLADSYDVTDDGLVYTFYLNKEVKWHDGNPFTAEDVEFTYKMMMHPDYTGSRYVFLEPIVGAAEYHDGTVDEVEGIKVLDDYTIEITLKNPYAPFLELVAQQIWILPKHIMGDTPIAEMDKHWMAKTPVVGTGPWKFERYAPDQYVEFVRNEDYFLGKPHIEKFIVKILKNDIALAQFEKGELDMTTKVGYMSPADIEKLQTLDVTIYPVSNGTVQKMDINNQLEYFKDPRIRTAFAMAIDRQAIIDQLLLGYGFYTNSPIPTFSPYYNEEQMEYQKYDPVAAKALLEEAGWDFNREITLNVPTGNVVRERSGTIIQQFLQNVGIKVKLEVTDFTTMIQKADKFETEIWLVGYNSGIFDPDCKSSFHSTMIAPNGWNGSSYNNPEADKLMDDGQLAVGFENRKPIYDALQIEFAKDPGSVFLYFPLMIEVVSNRVKNANPVAPGADWNVHEWYIVESD